jgi:iron complex transport system ATP-binding protein
MLSVRSLTFSYDAHPVLQDINLSVQAGEILAVIGPNGAGKSTLVKAISGVLPTPSSHIFIGGEDISHLSFEQRARKTAVVSQARDLPPYFSVYQTVLLGRTPYLNWLGRPSTVDHDRVRYSLEQTQLDEFADRLVGELSGGEQQRVLLARALAQDTPLMLLDEPTTHLDLQYQSNILNLVNRLAHKDRIAVLVVLHELNMASLYSDRIALLVNGEIYSIGEPENVLTSKNLSEVFKIPVNVIPHPHYGTPLVLPDGRISEASFHRNLHPSSDTTTK